MGWKIKKGSPAYEGGATAPALVDIAAWKRDDDFPIFPVGSKPKLALFCPTPAPLSLLIAGHRYLFKISTGWRINQHWSEMIAYKLSTFCGVAAAPSFIAMDSRTGEVGVLIEFFYGYPEDAMPARFLAGADLMRRTIERFDEDTEAHHTWKNALRVSRQFMVPEPLRWWGKLVAFDALIGNTDRHSENWGLLATKTEGKWSFRMAPVFDQGTSLAYQITDEQMSREATDEAISRHIARGNHHLRWEDDAGVVRGHFDVCRLAAKKYPSIVPDASRVAAIPEQQVERIVHECCEFDLPQGSCRAERAEYLVKLLKARTAALRAAFEVQ